LFFFCFFFVFVLFFFCFFFFLKKNFISPFIYIIPFHM
jgi:hypothetical protein